MSVSMYPAYLVENKIISHADDWNEDCTINLAIVNFYSLTEELNLSRMMVCPGHIRLRTLEIAMQMHQSPRYHARLVKLCAQAHVLKARYIAFS